MRQYSLLVLVLVFVLAYLIGTRYPSPGAMVLSKVGL
jgi:hypothetical protein